MGLDTVDILLEAEEVFGISISNAEAAELGTPDMLARLVASRVLALPDEFCLTQQTFYQLRRAFRTAMPGLRTSIRLDTPLSEITTREQWPDLWRVLRDSADGAAWPETMPWPTWRNFGTGPKTIRDLVWHLAVDLAPTPGQAPARWTRQQVEHAVRRIVLEQTGVEPSYDAEKNWRELGIE